MESTAPGRCPGRFALILQLMKHRLPVFEGTDVPKNVFQNVTGAERILPHPVAAVGVGADGDDLAPQLPEAPENVGGRKKIAAAVNAAGVHFQPLTLCGQNPENFVDDFPMGGIGQGRMGGVTGGLADISQMCQYVEIPVNLNTGQGFLQIPLLHLMNGLPLPERLKIHVKPVHKMDGAEDEIKGTPGKVFPELRRIIPGKAKLHTPPDGQPGKRKMVVFCVVVLRAEGQVAHLPGGVIVQMVGEADFLQPGVQRRLRHSAAGVVAVKGNPGMHVEIKHLSLSPPKTGGTPWAAPPGRRSALP